MTGNHPPDQPPTVPSHRRHVLALLGYTVVQLVVPPASPDGATLVEDTLTFRVHTADQEHLVEVPLLLDLTARDVSLAN